MVHKALPEADPFHSIEHNGHALLRDVVGAHDVVEEKEVTSRHVIKQEKSLSASKL